MPQSHFTKVASCRFTTSFKRGTGVFLWVLRNFSEDLFKRMQVFWKTATETGYKSFSSALWNHRNSLGTKWERICPSWKYILREKCPNTEFFQVRIFPHSDKKKLRIWTLFTQWIMSDTVDVHGQSFTWYFFINVYN